jgi:hypothetical protein
VEERVDRGQPRVAGANAVASFVLQVGEKRGDRRGVEILKLQPRWCCPGALVHEGQQQPEAVAVGGNRVRAGVALLSETFDEERLQQRRERAHC